MSDVHPIYMEPRALEFLRAWPDVPETLRPAYSRFYDAGMIWVDPNVDSDGHTWPGQLRLTGAGEALKEIVDSQTFNFFTARQLQPIIGAAMARQIFKDELPTSKKGVYAQRERGLRAAMAGLGFEIDTAISVRTTNRGKV